MFPYIDLGFFQLPMYGVMLFTAFLAALWLARRRAPQYGLTKEAVVDLATLMIVCGLIGGRLLYVFLNVEYFIQHPAKIVFNRSDFVFFGGAAGGLLALIVYCRYKSLDSWNVGDAIAPAGALGHAIGRIGCLFQGCCYGRVCHLPWAIRFPANRDFELFYNPAFAAHVERYGLSPDAPYSLPVHPSQLYESVLNLAICGILLWLSPRRRFRGQLVLSYGTLYAASRFSVEFTRGDLERGGWSWLSTSQWISLALLATCAVLWRLRGKKPA